MQQISSQLQHTYQKCMIRIQIAQCDVTSSRRICLKRWITPKPYLKAWVKWNREKLSCTWNRGGATVPILQDENYAEKPEMTSLRSSNAALGLTIGKALNRFERNRGKKKTLPVCSNTRSIFSTSGTCLIQTPKNKAYILHHDLAVPQRRPPHFFYKR